MTHAYDEIYLGQARVSLGRMLDFAVYDLNYDVEKFFDMFITSGVAARFEVGDCSIVAGKSGIEIAYMVLERSGLDIPWTNPKFTANRSEEYWTGWALAYYQWETALSFAEVVGMVSIKRIQSLYVPYHEMDIQQFCDRMYELCRIANSETNQKDR